MPYLGFDTSNYTTSVALYYPDENRIHHVKRLLPVKSGEKGLRQSDAVFHHTKALHTLCDALFDGRDEKINAVCASVAPRSAEGSYMPCFLVGENTGRCLSAASNAPFYAISHQQGHILAALYSVGRLDLINEKFVAFHLSGGTTEALLVEPDDEELIKCTLIASSLDLKAGQAVDRVGLMLNLDFPCGPELEKLALKSTKNFRIRPTVIDGNCSLSGVENKCRKMLNDSENKEDIALFCIEYIKLSLEKMTDSLICKYGNLPLVYAGGVMSNSIIRDYFKTKYGAYFAESQFSCDNAAGVAIAGYLKDKKNEE